MRLLPLLLLPLAALAPCTLAALAPCPLLYRGRALYAQGAGDAFVGPHGELYADGDLPVLRVGGARRFELAAGNATLVGLAYGAASWGPPPGLNFTQSRDGRVRASAGGALVVVVRKRQGGARWLDLQRGRGTRFGGCA